MKNYQKVAAIVCLLLTMSALLFSVPAGAVTVTAPKKVTVSLSSDKTNVRVGNTFVITVSLNVQNGSGTLIYSFDGLEVEYDTSLFDLKSVSSVGSQNIKIIKSNPVEISYDRDGDACEDINDEIATLTFQVKTTAVLGETSFKVRGPSKAFKDMNETGITTEYDSPYTGVTIADKMSDNSYLSNLIVNEGTLSPSFKKDTIKYSVKVPNNVTRVNLVYNTEDSAAKVTVTNATNLKVGANTVKVAVTAEDGSSRVYTLTVTRSDSSAAASSEGSQITSSSAQGGTITEDQYNKELQKVKNRYLIIILVLVFAVLAELAYILIEKFAKKKPVSADGAKEKVASPVKSGEVNNSTQEDIGEPQSIIDSILNNTDDENNQK